MQINFQENAAILQSEKKYTKKNIYTAQYKPESTLFSHNDNKIFFSSSFLSHKSKTDTRKKKVL